MKEKISLRKLKNSDIDFIMDLFVDREIINPLGLDKKLEKITRKFEKNWLKETIKNYKRKKPEKYNLAILLNKEYIGGIGCHKIDYKNKSLEIGYWIGKQYWNKGYTTKALKLFLKEIRKRFNPVRIIASYFIFNPASGKVLKKCGFSYEGIQRKAYKKGKKFLDLITYALVR